MSTDNFDDDMPKIILDKEDREAYQKGRSKSAPTSYTPEKSPEPEASSKAPKSGGNPVLLTFTLLLTLSAGGACYWLYEQNEAQQKLLLESQQRIDSLERQLSDTGEEMGESTVALQAKVKALSEKSEELWGQMDKLWASAWRRNQSEIKGLSDQFAIVQKQSGQQKQQIALLESDSGVLQTNLAAFQEQFSKQQNQLKNVQSALQAMAQTDGKNVKKLAELTDKMAEVVMQNQSLVMRMADIEDKVRELSKPAPTEAKLPPPVGKTQ